MGYFIDLMYVLYELVKLSFLVVTSPLGILAGFLLVWQ
jgi:hypothetical protein